MASIETFSKRMKQLENTAQADVVQYDDLPKAFRVQIIVILTDTIGPFGYRSHSWGERSERDGFPSNAIWRIIHDKLARELGEFDLSTTGDNAYEKCKHFLLTVPTLQALDLIELAFRLIEKALPEYQRDKRYEYEGLIKQSCNAAIEELNHRFREHSIGYEFVSGQLIRRDSQIIHADAVRPALHLLADPVFKGPNDEFRRAHEHHRYGRTKEAVQEALKAFESTMKTICDLRKWTYQQTDTAKHLIKAIRENELIPSFLGSSFNALASVLEGLPTVRNKLAGHRQGAQPIEVPAYLAAYALHLAASNIVMLVEAHKNMK